jgi:hypothetical protein
MTVIPIPPAITGLMRTCPGASTILSDATHSGVWTSNNISVATVNPSTGIVYGISPNLVAINYTVRPGCTVTTTVTVNPNPSPILGNGALCATLLDTLYDTTSSGVWSTTTPGLATINSTTGVLTALAGGNAIVNYTLPATGCKATKTVVIHPLPNPVITYNWQTATLYVDSFYYAYQWYDDLQGLIAGATSPSLAALYTQNYWVVVTDSFGCVNVSPLFFFDATVLNVNNVAGAQVKVYPNPASSIVYIESSVRVRAVVAGIDGKALLAQDDAKEINISMLADGMYFITLYNDDKQPIATRKLLKQ